MMRGCPFLNTTPVGQVTTYPQINVTMVYYQLSPIHFTNSHPLHTVSHSKLADMKRAHQTDLYGLLITSKELAAWSDSYTCEPCFTSVLSITQYSKNPLISLYDDFRSEGSAYAICVGVGGEASLKTVTPLLGCDEVPW